MPGKAQGQGNGLPRLEHTGCRSHLRRACGPPSLEAAGQLAAPAHHGHPQRAGATLGLWSDASVGACGRGLATACSPQAASTWGPEIQAPCPGPQPHNQGQHMPWSVEATPAGHSGPLTQPHAPTSPWRPRGLLPHLPLPHPPGDPAALPQGPMCCAGSLRPWDLGNSLLSTAAIS